METTFDSRDIEAKLAELLDEKAELLACVEEAEKALLFAEINDASDTGDLTEKVSSAKENLRAWEEDEDCGGSMVSLVKLREDVNSSEWSDGVLFIHASYWVKYVEEMLKDIGEMPSSIPSYIEIDWDATAENVRADYSAVDFDGGTYYYRDC
jgi:hypothetical protein